MVACFPEIFAVKKKTELPNTHNLMRMNHQPNFEAYLYVRPHFKRTHLNKWEFVINQTEFHFVCEACASDVL